MGLMEMVYVCLWVCACMSACPSGTVIGPKSRHSFLCPCFLSHQTRVGTKFQQSRLSLNLNCCWILRWKPRVLRLLRSTPELPSAIFALQTNKLLGLALVSLPWSKADVLLLRLNSLFPSGAQPKSRSEAECLIEEPGGSNITAVGAVCVSVHMRAHIQTCHVLNTGYT